MSDLLGTDVAELVATMRQRGTRLPFEIGAFVALETAEALLRGPAVVEPRQVRIGNDGTVSVFAPPHSATSERACRAVVDLLAHLLVAAGHGVPTAFLDLVENGPGDGRWDLARLRDDLEASLVPLNRQAARRVLARMVRELRRPQDARAPAPSPTDHETVDAAAADAELDALLDEADEARTAATRPAPRAGDSRGLGDDVWGDMRGATPSASTVDASAPPRIRIALDDDSREQTLERIPTSSPVGAPAALDEPFTRPATGALPPRPRPLAASEPIRSDPAAPIARASPMPAEHPAANASRHRASPTPEPRGASSEVGRPEAPATAAPASSRPPRPEPAATAPLDLSALEESAPRGSTARWLVLVLVVAMGTGAFTLWRWRPDVVERLLGGGPAPEAAAREALERDRQRAQAELERAHAARFGDLVVHVEPARAQVLLFAGRAPVVVRDLPRGVAHELVAIADGHAPARALVPADAAWDMRPEGATFELALQASRPFAGPFEELDLGRSLMPPQPGAPGADLGTVRVVTNPPGAKVYLLVGFSPHVRIENVRTDEPIELLAWLEGHAPARILVGPSDFVERDGRRVAESRVTLTPRTPERRR
ncbi:MAG: hypothetical protein NZ898_09745 [Myxococcota bacterium]|nr:hypothetical protein [Myxococcota bacterium]MDW8363553.1 hypothetical protein [Myxococcales bacterium]